MVADNTQISRLNVDEHGGRCIALLEEHESNIISCLQYLLDGNDLDKYKVERRLQTEHDYKSHVILGQTPWYVSGWVYSVSKWKIKDQAKDIDDEYTIILRWGIVH